MRDNISTLGGGLDVSYDSNPLIEDCTFSGNQALLGGAIHIIESGLVIKGCIFWGNTADDGAAIALRYFYQLAMVHISWCDLQDGIHLEEGSSIDYGPGMINADPLFIRGPDGSCYLSQIAAGQGADSPCLDAGDPSIALPPGSTRTDHWPDQGVADMGFHREPNWAPICDVDGSGRVDGWDLAALALAWGATAGEPRYDPRADFDNSRTVDGEDLAILASVFGETV